MPSKSSPPNFKQFTQWVRHKVDVEPIDAQVPPGILAAARSARDQTLESRNSPHGMEVLRLLAAASTHESSRPPELMTAKGFRVTLAYDGRGTGGTQPSICVLVQCPLELSRQVQGQTAYLWNGSERFELGQFDADGKAIGTLPAGIEITPSDFETGNVNLETPVLHPTAEDP